MKITVEFNSLEEMREYAAFVLGETAPQTAPAPGVLPNTNPAPAVQTGPGVVTQQPFTGVQPPADQPVQTGPVPQTGGEGGVPTAAPSYTIDDLARAAQPLMDAGRRADLQALLQSFGVAALPMIPQESYGAFATALRNMGAQI